MNKNLIFKLIYSLLAFCSFQLSPIPAHAETLDFSKAQIVLPGEHSFTNMQYNVNYLYSVKTNKNDELINSMSITQNNQVRGCDSKFTIKVFDPYKSELSSNWLDALLSKTAYGETYSYSDNNVVKNSGYHYLFVKIAAHRYFDGTTPSETECQKVLHSMSASLEVKYSTPAGPDFRTCIKKQKIRCKNTAKVRNWNEDRTNQCIRKRIQKKCSQ